MKNRIFLVGLAGSGKTHISRLFEEMGVAVIHVGQRVKEYLKLGKANYGLIEKLTEENPYFVSKVLFESTSGIDDLVVFEGAKSLNDLHYFAEKPLVYSVFSPRQKRLERIIKRARYRDVTDNEGLIARDKREISYGARGIILSGDEKIENCWSDEVIQLIRLEQFARGFNPELADSIKKRIEINYSLSKIESAAKDAIKNDERARKENYWTHELDI